MSTSWEVDGRSHGSIKGKTLCCILEFSVYKLKFLIAHFFCSFICFLGMTGAQVIQMLNQNYRLPKPLNCPKNFYSIMLKCWDADPKERPKFETLYRQLEIDSSYSDTNIIS